jgi:hypothetical protein
MQAKHHCKEDSLEWSGGGRIGLPSAANFFPAKQISSFEPRIGCPRDTRRAAPGDSAAGKDHQDAGCRGVAGNI